MPLAVRPRSTTSRLAPAACCLAAPWSGWGAGVGGGAEVAQRVYCPERTSAKPPPREKRSLAGGPPLEADQHQPLIEASRRAVGPRTIGQACSGTRRDVLVH